MRIFIKFSCPRCNAQNQKFSVLRALSRIAKTDCKKCGLAIHSELGHIKHLLFLVYVHIVLLIVAIPFVMALAGGKWLVAVAAFSVFAALTWPPAMVIHARNARAYE
jgi:hypothetical protein